MGIRSVSCLPSGIVAATIFPSNNDLGSEASNYATYYYGDT